MHRFVGAAFNLTDEQLSAFPEVQISLVGSAGVDVPLPIGPEDYMVRLPNGLYRLGITNGDCIIGNTHMLKYWTVYDRKNLRLGFAPSIRSKCEEGRLKLIS